MALRKHTSKEIGQTIKRIRLGLRLSQQELGKQLGYSQDTVAKWEGGQIPHVVALQQIARICHRSIDWIMKGHKGKKRAIPNGVGSDAYGSKKKPVLRKERYLDSRAEHPAVNQATAASQNPFEVFTDQLRVVVREEVQAALKNGVRTANLPVVPISLDWLRAMGLSRQPKRHGNGFKRSNARVK